MPVEADSDLLVVEVRGALLLHYAVLLSFLSGMILGALVDHHSIIAQRPTHSGSSTLSEMLQDLLAIGAVKQLLACSSLLSLSTIVPICIFVGTPSEVVIVDLLIGTIVLIELD